MHAFKHNTYHKVFEEATLAIIIQDETSQTINKHRNVQRIVQSKVHD